MSIPSQSGIWSMAPQPAKIGAEGTFNKDVLSWYRHRAPRVTAGTVQGQQIFPLETGGPIVPTGVYKDSQYYAGQVDLHPRLENAIGWMLYAALGNVTTATGTDADGNAVAGLYTHTFRFNPANSFELPWFASRLMTPGETTANDSGEIGFDCKASALSLTIPAMGKLAMRFGFTGRDSEFDVDPSDWTYANTTEDPTTVPDSGNGTFKIAGVTYPLTGLMFELGNQLTTPQQEMIVGSFNPDDFVPLTRSISARIQYKYENAELCRQIYTGQVNGTEWSSLPYTAKTDRTSTPVYALEGVFQSPKNISQSLARPYRMLIRGHHVTVAKDGPSQIQAGDIIQEGYTLTFLEPDSGENYVEIIIENDVAAYAWPTP